MSCLSDITRRTRSSPLSTGQNRHTDTVPVSSTKKKNLDYVYPHNTVLDTAYHTTYKRNYSQHSFNDKINTADGLKLTLSSIQGMQASALFHSGTISTHNVAITLQDSRHIVERIPSQHAKLRISTYIITSKATRCVGHYNPSSINLILRISYSNIEFYEQHQADRT
jgi:hypothetical protein